MSGAAVLVPADPSFSAAPTEISLADVLPAFQPVPVDPTPGDPDTVYIPPNPQAQGLDVVLILNRAGSHQKVAELLSADVEGYDDPLSILNPSEISWSASLFDPGWTLAGAEAEWIGDRYRLVFDWRAYELEVVVDGVSVAAGFIDDDVEIEGATIRGTASGPAAALRGTIGDAGTSDSLNGAGSFDTAGGSAGAWLSSHGWDVPGTLEIRWNTTDPFSGARSLQVRGIGELRAPVVAIQGDDHFRRTRLGSAMVRHTESYVVAITRVFRDGATEIDQDLAERRAKGSNETVEDWQPVAAIGTLERVDSVQFMRMCFRIYSISGWVDIDEVRYPLDGYTGSRTKVDLAAYPGRIMRRVQELNNGDAQALGIPVHSAVPTGILEQIWWPDFEDVSIIEALKQVMDRQGGPEVWFAPNWQMWVSPRRGRNRFDVVLTDDTVLTPRWGVSPRSIVDQLRVLTPFGTEEGRIGFAYDTPRPLGVRILRQIVQAPTDLSYEQQRAWGAYQAERASREQWYAELDVSDAYGSLISTGDGIRAVLGAGNHGWAGWVRVANRRRNLKTRTWTLTVGLEPGVLPTDGAA